MMNMDNFCYFIIEGGGWVSGNA